MTYELTFEQIQKCKRVFDNNKSNPLNDRDDIRLPSENLIKAFTDLDFDITQKELNSIMFELGMDPDISEIDFSSFLRIALVIFKQEEFNLCLEDAFKSFDEDNKKSLDYAQLKNILTQYGPKLEENDAEDLIKDFIDENQNFDYKEFISKNF
jgi:Ca2+-binding EF-hand superfamily protein